MTDDTTVSQHKFDQLEERVRGTENSMAALSSSITLNTNNLKENMDKAAAELDYKINGLKENIKDNQQALSSLNESLQNLYVSVSSSQHSVKSNEKIIWAIATFIFTGGLYLIQEFLRASGNS